MRVLQELAAVLPLDLNKLRCRIQESKEDMADAMRDMYEGHQQLRRRRQ